MKENNNLSCCLSDALYLRLPECESKNLGIKSATIITQRVDTIFSNISTTQEIISSRSRSLWNRIQQFFGFHRVFIHTTITDDNPQDVKNNPDKLYASAFFKHLSYHTSKHDFGKISVVFELKGTSFKKSDEFVDSYLKYTYDLTRQNYLDWFEYKRDNWYKYNNK